MSIEDKYQEIESDEELNMSCQNDQNDDFHVDPYKVAGKVDYMKLIKKFGTSPIEGNLLKRWESVTKVPLHHLIRRGLVFSHRDIEKILDQKEKGEPIYLYTGRGPSTESMHLGHAIPFILTKYLQDALDAILIIQMSDDEKFFFKDGNLESFNKYCYLNAKDIIAFGFDIDKTFIFSNLESMGGDLYFNVAKIMKATNGNQVEGIFGLNLNNNIGQLVWPSMQSAPAFSTSFKDIFKGKTIPCFVAMAIDQDPFFRLARHVAKKLDSPKPAVIHSRFLPGLTGPGKMSATDTNNTTIFLDMNPNDVSKTIKKHAFSGGRDTKENQIKYGADIKIDVCYQYLCYFMESDDKLKEIAEKYSSGELLTGEIKEITSKIICDFILNHQENKKNITDDIVKIYFDRNRNFDLLKPTKYKAKLEEELQTCLYKEYDNYGMNFDLTFGFKPKGESVSIQLQ